MPVRCIQVASPRGMFLVSQIFIPTHNSSLGRLGLLIHSTAGYVDPGWKGNLTLELSNVANLPIALYFGMRIGQICFFRMSSPVERPYGIAGARARSTRASPSRPPRRSTATSRHGRATEERPSDEATLTDGRSTTRSTGRPTSAAAPGRADPGGHVPL